MAANDRIRLEIAFEGQQVLTVHVTAAIADELDQALAAQNDASMTFDAEDGRYTVVLRRVVYVKRFAREGRVGFSSG